MSADWRVECPVCGSTARRCKRPSGHDADAWHIAREDALARLHPECAGCRAWLGREKNVPAHLHRELAS